MHPYIERKRAIEDRLANDASLSDDDRILLLCERGIMSRTVYDMARAIREIETIVRDRK